VIQRLAVTLCAGLALLLTACGEEQAETDEIVRPVRAVKIGDVESLIRRSLPGRAKAVQEVNLSFRIAGSLISFPTLVGQEVAEGDLLARLDPRDHEVNLRTVEGQLERAKAELEAMKVARPEDISRAKADVRAADADLTLAKQELRRLVSIREEDSGAIAAVRIDQAEASKGVAQAALASAQEMLAIATSGARPEDIIAKESEIASLAASVDSARDNLSYTYMRAPFAGTIVATYVQNFEDVQAKASIMRLLDTDSIEMVVDIPERSISNLNKLLKITVKFDAFPDYELLAEISEVGTEASLTTRTYPVTLLMEQPDDIKILPGMAGRATAEISEGGDSEDGGPLVPVSAVFSPEDSQQSFVWVINTETNKAERRPVQTGRLTALGIVVTDGVTAGEWVDTAGVNSLREGQAVRLLEPENDEG
jgi:multidrug efflux pump subunit AcrA (membrane-fusion protein)